MELQPIGGAGDFRQLRIHPFVLKAKVFTQAVEMLQPFLGGRVTRAGFGFLFRRHGAAAFGNRGSGSSTG